MTREVRYIVDFLDDIRRIVSFYSSSIDYSQYIEDLNACVGIIDNLASRCDSEEDRIGVFESKQRAMEYLSTIEKLQKIYQDSISYQPGAEK